MTRSRQEQRLLESVLTERSAPAAAMLLRCKKCHAPFLDDTPQPHHPTVDIQALRSNLLPSREVISQMHNLVEAEMSDLNRLEETIRSVRDTLRELENRRDTLRQEIQRRKSWGTPIRRIPVEVLQEIFTHVCMGDARNQFSLDISSHVEDGYCGCRDDCWHCEQCEADPVLSKTTIVTTVALSQVCFHWRSIIIASPSLWSSLRLDVSQMKRRHANLVKLYLRRSVQHPLKMSLRQETYISSDRDLGSEDSIEDVVIGQVGSGVLRSVMKELYRCRELHYEPDRYDLIGFVPEHCRPKGFPLLSSFSDRVYREPSHVDRWFWDLVKVAPNLIDVSVDKFRADSFPKNLRNLTIRKQDYTAFLEMLSRCPKLVSLNLHDFMPGWCPAAPPHTPHPIHTRKFTITTSKNLSNLDLLFSFVILSSLSSLEIFTGQEFSGNDGHTTDVPNRIYYGGSASNFGALRALIQRSACSLEDLTLHVESYSSGAIISLLELMPSLARLNLEMWVPRERVEAFEDPEPSVLVDLFTRMSEPQSPLLPCIRNLDIQESRKDTGYDTNKQFKIAASALDMAESRERRGEPIPNISLALDRPISGDHTMRHCLPNELEQRVKELAARGVKCRIALPKVLSHSG
ncbi:hypothetical protein VNI00_002093 [Paramarasmius palmivorus]|uniref:F-box domain-containing protein n=1 Tax=Paramarasmius palmivorus TaxID=297713 RepID=A0AAW0E3X9_9AGAR